MRVSAAGNMPLQGLVKPPAKPVVMILDASCRMWFNLPCRRETLCDLQKKMSDHDGNHGRSDKQG